MPDALYFEQRTLLTLMRESPLCAVDGKKSICIRWVCEKPWDMQPANREKTN